LGTTPWSIALPESFRLWPLLESSHVLTTGLFVGVDGTAQVMVTSV